MFEKNNLYGKKLKKEKEFLPEKLRKKIDYSIFIA